MGRLQKKLNLLNALNNVKDRFAKYPRPPLENSASFFKSGDNPDRSADVFSGEGHNTVRDDRRYFASPARDASRFEGAVPCSTCALGEETSHLIFRRIAAEFWPSNLFFCRLLGQHSRKEGFLRRAGLAGRPEEWLFMDIETCGFSGNPIFLIGAAWLENGLLQLEQYFARDYSGEADILEAFSTALSRHPHLITYNGMRFDWPMIEERSAVCGVEPFFPAAHLDLLPAFRKAWKGRLPNFKLQTLEKVFCLRKRRGDLPGSEIPAAYHEFVENPEAFQDMVRAVHHNALDVITLAELALVLGTGESQAVRYLKEC